MPQMPRNRAALQLIDVAGEHQTSRELTGHTSKFLQLHHNLQHFGGF
jgi:hypothetical protein